MLLVVFYSVLLIAGIICSQSLNLTHAAHFLGAMTGTCLAYIMIEVGIGFTIDKRRLKSYGWDFLFALLAAVLPWILCAGYFKAFFAVRWSEAFLMGIFAAPTSAGILFAMLAAAGLGATWLFRKAQVLAVFDDFDAILLLVPLQIIFVGFRVELFATVFLMLGLLVLAFLLLHSLPFPIERQWFALYGIAIVLFSRLMHAMTGVDIGILLPAFTFGALLRRPPVGGMNLREVPQRNPAIYGGEVHSPRDGHPYDYTHQEPVNKRFLFLDRFIKGLFMFLVGCSLPKMQLQSTPIGIVLTHVLMLTLLCNAGKCFLFFCYRDEASWRKRLALSIAMFPRGEVGAGVLLIAMGYGLNGLAISLSVLSLALNLILTGVFITVAIWLVRAERDEQRIAP